MKIYYETCGGNIFRLCLVIAHNHSENDHVCAFSKNQSEIQISSCNVDLDHNPFHACAHIYLFPYLCPYPYLFPYPYLSRANTPYDNIYQLTQYFHYINLKESHNVR